MNRYKFSDLKIGMKEGFDFMINEEKMEAFKKITGDVNPLHNDEEFAKSRDYKNRVGFGMLTASFLSTLAGVYLPGENSLIQQVEVKFTKPVLLGTKCHIEGEIIELNETFKQMELKVTVNSVDENSDWRIHVGGVRFCVEK